MMLAFVENPFKHRSWLDQGGYETLLSYGLALDPSAPLDMPLRRLRQILAAHLPTEHLDWLGTLPFGHMVTDQARDGAQTWVLAHAGFDPDHDFSDQPSRTLVWGAGWNTAGFIGAAAFNFVATLVVTRTLGVDGYARYSYLLWLASVGSLVASAGLARPVARFVAFSFTSGARMNAI